VLFFSYLCNVIKIATDKEQAFIISNIDINISSLLLHKSKYTDIDIGFCAGQIEGLQVAKEKFPFLFECEDFLFAPHMNLEQASSQLTAKYKASLLNKSDVVADLCAGVGVDSIFFAHNVKKVLAFETNTELCELDKHNFEVLGLKNITITCEDANEALLYLKDVSVIYLDPSRRDSNKNRVYQLKDCSPNILEMFEELFACCQKLMLKLSPMLELNEVIRKVPFIKEIHIVSVKNECKELLLILQKDYRGDINYHCINFLSESKKEEFVFFACEEQKTIPIFCKQETEKYIYIPNASILKSGASNTICSRFGVSKLSIKTNLYTSSSLLTDFQGRGFEVIERLSPSKVSNKTFAKANIIARNYPLSVNQIRQKTKIKEGGEDFLIFTTLQKDTKATLWCHIANH